MPSAIFFISSSLNFFNQITPFTYLFQRLILFIIFLKRNQKDQGIHIIVNLGLHHLLLLFSFFFVGKSNFSVVRFTKSTICFFSLFVNLPINTRPFIYKKDGQKNLKIYEYLRKMTNRLYQ